MKKQEEYVRSLGISLEEVKDQNEELLDSNKGLEKNVKCLEKRFVLLKRNDSQHYQYYTIRAQFGYRLKMFNLAETI
jgi:hypothetical protein